MVVLQTRLRFGVSKLRGAILRVRLYKQGFRVSFKALGLGSIYGLGRGSLF